MSDRALRVLLVDDDEEDYLITKDILSAVPHTRYDVAWVSRCEEVIEALRSGGFDVCLLDYRLEGCTGLDVLKDAASAGCNVPIIMLTGAADEAVDIAAMSAGAADYLVKGRLDPQVLERAIRYAIGHKKSELQLKRYAESLEQSNKELVRAHEELALKNAELQRLNEEKNHLLGMAAHDLRNPLGVILGYSDYILMSRRRAKVRSADAAPALRDSELEIIGRITSSSKFMLSLINDLLDISTIESGKLRLDKKSTDLVELVRANVALNTVLASQKNMSIVLDAAERLPRVDVDPRKVEQVLNNLISNAIHYASPGTTIDVRVLGDGGAGGADHVTISVRDQGPGIVAEDIANLFRPFGRAKSVSTGGERSTGLGLAIARRIVEGHGGRIWVESELARGSTFYAAFPFTPGSESAPLTQRVPT